MAHFFKISTGDRRTCSAVESQFSVVEKTLHIVSRNAPSAKMADPIAHTLAQVSAGSVETEILRVT